MSENTKNQFGATSWDIDTNNGFKPRENTKDLYLRLEQGSNVVRVLTKPHEYLCHQWKVNPADPGFGSRVNSSKFYGSDVLEEKYNSKAKRRWMLYVIDRKTASVKLLDISKSVFDGIRELVRDNDDWGDPSQYDIDIKVDKQGGPTNYYKVIPKSNVINSLKMMCSIRSYLKNNSFVSPHPSAAESLLKAMPFPSPKE